MKCAVNLTQFSQETPQQSLSIQSSLVLTHQSLNPKVKARPRTCWSMFLHLKDWQFHTQEKTLKALIRRSKNLRRTAIVGCLRLSWQ